MKKSELTNLIRTLVKEEMGGNNVEKTMTQYATIISNAIMRQVFKLISDEMSDPKYDEYNNIMFDASNNFSDKKVENQAIFYKKLFGDLLQQKYERTF